jgi:hypothetical protein
MGSRHPHTLHIQVPICQFAGGISIESLSIHLAHIPIVPYEVVCLGVVAPEVCASAMTMNKECHFTLPYFFVKIATWAHDSNVCGCAGSGGGFYLWALYY